MVDRTEYGVSPLREVHQLWWINSKLVKLSELYRKSTMIDIDYDLYESHCIQFEAKVNHLYLDTKNILTTGIGCQVFDPYSLPFLVMQTGQPATQDEIAEEVRSIRALEAGKIVSYYRKVAKLFLTEETIRALFRERIDEAVKDIESHVPGLAYYPPSSVLAIVDMRFNCGTKIWLSHPPGFPTFVAAFQKKDWHVCSQEYRRVGIPQERNDWTRDIFITLDKANG